MKLYLISILVCTCVGILHQHPQRVGVYPLHLHLILLGFSNIAGEHGGKVVGHGGEDESVRTESASDVRRTALRPGSHDETSPTRKRWQ